MKKIHLGCGKREFPGFINVDICDFPHIHHKSSIKSLPFFEDNSIDYIYCSHALEYYDSIEAIEVLREWKRVMKHKATLRVCVPNFDSLLKVYDDTNDLDTIIGPLYGRMFADDKLIYHKTVYNFKKISRLLSDIGFKHIKEYDWRDTDHADYDDHSQAYFPHMDKKNGILVSLNIECKK